MKKTLSLIITGITLLALAGCQQTEKLSNDAQKAYTDTKDKVTETADKIQEKAQQAQDAANAFKKLTE